MFCFSMSGLQQIPLAFREHRDDDHLHLWTYKCSTLRTSFCERISRTIWVPIINSTNKTICNLCGGSLLESHEKRIEGTRVKRKNAEYIGRPYFLVRDYISGRQKIVL